MVETCSLVIAIEETLSHLIQPTSEPVPEQEVCITSKSKQSLADGKSFQLQKALKAVYKSVNDPALRLQLLHNLPAFGFGTAVFRRRLALAFFFHDTTYLKKPAEESMVDLNSVADHLQNPRFTITKTTDYAVLTADLAMLNIGIDTGDPALPFSTTKDEIRFDNAVDMLSTRIKELSTQIIGTSALNMRRTEAKEILDGIQRRLSYAVRSRPPPKKTILVDSDHERGEGGDERVSQSRCQVERAGCSPD